MRTQLFKAFAVVQSITAAWLSFTPDTSVTRTGSEIPHPLILPGMAEIACPLISFTPQIRPRRPALAGLGADDAILRAKPLGRLMGRSDVTTASRVDGAGCTGARTTGAATGRAIGRSDDDNRGSSATTGRGFGRSASACAVPTPTHTVKASAPACQITLPPMKRVSMPVFTTLVVFDRTSEIGCVRILSGLDDATTDRTGASEIVKQVVPIARADGTLQGKQLFREAAKDL